MGDHDQEEGLRLTDFFLDQYQGAPAAWVGSMYF